MTQRNNSMCTLIEQACKRSRCRRALVHDVLHMPALCIGQQMTLQFEWLYKEACKANLNNGNPHEPDPVVGQQLDFDGGVAHKRQSHSPEVGGHGGQPNLEPQLALQIQIRH